MAESLPPAPKPRPPSEELASLALVALHALPAIVAIVLGGLAVWGLQDVLTPIFLAFVIAYMLDPLVDRLEARKIPRGIGILLVMVGFVVALAGFLLFVIPSLVEDIIRVAKDVPRRVAVLATSIEPWLRSRGVSVPHSVEEAISRFGDQLGEAAPTALGGATQVLQTAGRGTLSFISGLGNVLVVMVITFYLLLDFDTIVQNAGELVPVRYRRPVGDVMREVDATLAQWIRGQLTVMLILGLLYSAGFSLSGVRLAVGIGILAGVLSFIPYVGTAVGLVLAVLMTLIDWHGPLPLFGVLLTVSLVQIADGLYITPRIVGGKVGLGPAWIIIALMTGGSLFGFLGVLLAVPTAAVIKILVKRLVAYYRHTELYMEAEGAGAATGDPAQDQPGPGSPPAEEPTAPEPYSPLVTQLEAAARGDVLPTAEPPPPPAVEPPQAAASPLTAQLEAAARGEPAVSTATPGRQSPREGDEP